MENFQDGQPRPEATKSSSGRPNDQLIERATANQTTQQSAGGDGGGANKSSITESGGPTDQSNGKISAAAAASPQSQQAQVASQSAISQAATGKRLGAKFVVPGESGNRYYLGLASTIETLGAKTQIEVYLAEKIFVCIWSMNRYEAQKRASLIAEMVKALQDGFSERSDTKLALTQLLEAGKWDELALKKVMQNKGFTESSLTQRAMERRMEEIIQLDEAIAVKAHTLKALQKSYESFACRSILQERLKLQNELLKRDLQAIDVQVLDRHSDVGNSDPRATATDFEAVDLPDEEAVDGAQDKPVNFKAKPKGLVRQSLVVARAINLTTQDESLEHGLGEGLAPSKLSPSDVTPKVTQARTNRKGKTTPPKSSHERL